MESSLLSTRAERHNLQLAAGNLTRTSSWLGGAQSDMTSIREMFLIAPAHSLVDAQVQREYPRQQRKDFPLLSSFHAIDSTLFEKARRWCLPHSRFFDRYARADL